jgi:CheY-like chemotaxis protein
MDAPVRHKILLLDDDPDLLELYRDILSRLPSRPEVHTVTSGTRALSLLASESFSLLLCDLKMPKMDGLQVLSIVRRKFPQLRTAVLTCLLDEQFRGRAYAMGIDLFLEKPNSSKEITFLLDCIESLLDREAAGGFRGVQSKSLVDLIQLECLSQSSSVLKISNGVGEGKIWVHEGDIIDANAGDAQGVEAFRTILSWKTGNFELLPNEPGHPRSIFTSYQGLLLETAQALDEAEATTQSSVGSADSTHGPTAGDGLAELSKFHGVEFVVVTSSNDPGQFSSRGAENPEQLAAWAQRSIEGFRALGETLQAGMLSRLEARSPMQNIAVVERGAKELCVGFHRSLPPESVRETMHKIVAKWAS